MIQMMTAYTTEVDEIEDGIAELLTQIDLNKLKKNSVGLITCHFDFAQTGFLAELQKRVSFDVIGMTTLASANNHGVSMYALSFSVLTSDDIVFDTAMSEPLGPDNYDEKIRALYDEVSVKTNGDPSMIISFFPYLEKLSGALMHNSLDKACKGIPVWGSLATNIDVSFERCHAFRNGVGVEDALVVLLMYGEVNPEFVVISIPEQNISDTRGMITESDGCIVKKINGMTAIDYLSSIGVKLIDKAPTVTPLMVYYEGSEKPVALGIYTIFDDGSLLCGGEMPIGATLAVGEINSKGIMETANKGVAKLLETGKKSGALILPCVTRYVMLTPDQNSEMQLIINTMKDTMPFMMGYSGGEVCPVRDDTGIPQNRFHNYTFSACIF